MAEKMVFIAKNSNPYYEKIIDYIYVPGFAPIQRKKNVVNLFESLRKEFPDSNALEISTKSDNELGKQLSAFNLRLGGYSVESIFQSSKVFADGSQYEFLIKESPLNAKRFIQKLPKQSIIKFRYKGIEYPTNPKSLFYDFIYIKALYENISVSKNLINYDIFTDIEFNYKKSINCQARACAIFTYLLKNNKVDEYLNNINLFKTLYYGEHSDTFTLFDFEEEENMSSGE